MEHVPQPCRCSNAVFPPPLRSRLEFACMACYCKWKRVGAERSPSVGPTGLRLLPEEGRQRHRDLQRADLLVHHLLQPSCRNAIGNHLGQCAQPARSAQRERHLCVWDSDGHRSASGDRRSGPARVQQWQHSLGRLLRIDDHRGLLPQWGDLQWNQRPESRVHDGNDSNPERTGDGGVLHTICHHHRTGEQSLADWEAGAQWHLG
jgi:hypothetical protein